MTAERSDAEAETTLGVRALGRLEKRARVVEAAQAVFREKGYEDAGMRLIAARAGVSVGTVFEVAKDKRSLLLLVFGDTLEQCTHRAIASLDRDAPLVDQLIHIYRGRYQFFYDDMRISMPLLQEVSFFFPDGHDPESAIGQYLAQRTAGRATIVELIAERQRRGGIDPAVDPRDLAAIVIAVHQVEMREWLTHDHPSVEDGLLRLRTLLDLALSGSMRPSRRKES